MSEEKDALEKESSKNEESIEEDEEESSNLVDQGESKVKIFSDQKSNEKILETKGVGPCIAVIVYGKANMGELGTTLNFVGLYHWEDKYEQYPYPSNAIVIPMESYPLLEDCIKYMKNDIKRNLFDAIVVELEDFSNSQKINSITIEGIALIGGQKAYQHSPEATADNIFGTTVCANALKILFTDHGRRNIFAKEMTQSSQIDIKFNGTLQLDTDRILIAQGEECLDLTIAVDHGQVIINHTMIVEESASPTTEQHTDNIEMPGSHYSPILKNKNREEDKETQEPEQKKPKFDKK